MQKFYRKNGGYRALLANLGMEYRDEIKGHYYVGLSLHFTITSLSAPCRSPALFG